MMTKTEIALDYLNHGLSVIPLWSPPMLRNSTKPFQQELEKKLKANAALDTPESDEDVKHKLVVNMCKVPMVSWAEYSRRLPTTDEVRNWFDRNPDANIGIVTGKVSGIVVFDLDSSGALEFADAQGGFPETAKVKSGKGQHVYAKYPGFEIRSSVNKKLDIDIRADGGYIVAPPSEHGSGHIYEWEEGHSIHEIAPAPCSPWMLDYLKSIAEGNRPSKTDREGGQNDPRVAQARSTADPHPSYTILLQNGAREGERNDSATRLIGHLLAKGLPDKEVWEIVRTWNAGKNTPPISEDELRRTFQSVKKLEDKRPKEETKEIEIDSLLDTPEKVIADYDQHYVRIPFAGELLTRMEAAMNGGLAGGRFYTLGGIPSASKTTLANNIADNICLSGHPVLFFSYDDGRTELRYRTYARFSGFGIEDFNQQLLEKSDLEAMAKSEAVRKITPLKYMVQELLKVEEWSKLIEKIRKRHGKAPAIIIDYLRKLKTEDSSTEERLRVDEILRSLTDLAKKYNIPVLAISELARDSYKGGQRLSMASFKETGSIEYESSWLGILAAVEENGEGYRLKTDWEKIIQQDGNIDLIVFKAKRGTGKTGKIPLKLEKESMTVRDRIESSKLDSFVPAKKKSKFE
jgi:replicative DNA helicase